MANTYQGRPVDTEFSDKWDYSFADAFKAARKKLGKGNLFKYDNKVYTTDYKEDTSPSILSTPKPQVQKASTALPKSMGMSDIKPVDVPDTQPISAPSSDHVFHGVRSGSSTTSDIKTPGMDINPFAATNPELREQTDTQFRKMETERRIGGLKTGLGVAAAGAAIYASRGTILPVAKVGAKIADYMFTAGLGGKALGKVAKVAKGMRAAKATEETGATVSKIRTAKDVVRHWEAETSGSIADIPGIAQTTEHEIGSVGEFMSGIGKTKDITVPTSKYLEGAAKAESAVVSEAKAAVSATKASEEAVAPVTKAVRAPRTPKPKASVVTDKEGVTIIKTAKTAEQDAAANLADKAAANKAGIGNVYDEATSVQTKVKAKVGEKVQAAKANVRKTPSPVPKKEVELPVSRSDWEKGSPTFKKKVVESYNKARNSKTGKVVKTGVNTAIGIDMGAELLKQGDKLVKSYLSK